MFDNLVIGIDGREGGHEAVGLARQLASEQARVTLAHIYGDSPILSAEGVPLSVERSDSRAILNKEQVEWPDADPVSVYASSVGRGLHELSVQRGSNLLVVGSCHHGDIGRVLMGDDTRASFNGAPCAIAIAPRGYSPEDEAFATLAVGYDGSPDSERALAAAREIAGRIGATIKVLWVVSPEDVREHSPLPVDWPRATEEMVQETQARLRDMPGVEGQAISGGPREELVKLSRHCNLLVVGSRGYGPWGSVFHGSVSSFLERHVESPLLVVPRPHADQVERALGAGESVTAPA